MAVVSVDGIVLRTRNLGEADRIITLYTRERGKVDCVARGARRARSRFIGATQLFTRGTYVLYTRGSLANLNQAEIVQSFTALREDLDKMAYASYYAELMDVFIDQNQPGEDVYDLGLATLHALHDDMPTELLSRWFEFNFMALLGYTPFLEACVGCGTSDLVRVMMSSREGGLLCYDCRAKDATAIPIQRSTIQWMHHLMHVKADRLPMLRLSDAELNVLETIGRNFIDYRAPRPLKSLSFLTTIQRLA